MEQNEQYGTAVVSSMSKQYVLHTCSRDGGLHQLEDERKR